MKLVDTDVFIDFFRGVEKSIEFIGANKNSIVFCAVTEAELLSGKECNDAKQREVVLHFLSQFEKIPVDNSNVQIAGYFRRKYGLELADAIIASTAISTDSELVTRNVKDFQKVKELKVQKPY